MDINRFDDDVRKMMDSFEDSPEVDVWSGVEKGLDRRRKIIIIKRVSYVAAAACLALGLILSIPKTSEVVRMADIYEGYIKVTPPQIEISPITHLKALNSVERRVQLINGVESTTDSVVTNSDVKEEKIAESVKVSEVVEVDRKSSDKSEERYYAQLFEEDSYYKKRRPISIGISSNILTSKGGSIDLSQPQYAPGGVTHHHGIIPISEPKFSLPMTFGIQAQMPIFDRLSAGIGVNYTILMGKYNGLIDNSSQGVVDETLNYIGVPVSLYFDLLSNDWLRLYLAGGGMYEKGIQQKSRILGLSEDIIYRNSSISGSQWSVNFGLGAEYQFSEHIGLFADPSLSYFFDCKQPLSIRTVQPFQFKLEIGLRFHLLN